MPKILVIDDEEAFRGALIAILEKRGFEVLEAPSGSIGVQLARAHLPDLILCDVNMGGVGGNLTLYALRRDPQIASIPFVLMSGLSSSGCAPPGMERGADGFLAKPFSTENLVSTIEDCLLKAARTSDEPQDSSSASSVIANVDTSSGLLEIVSRILHISRLIGNTSRPLQPNEMIDLADKSHQAAEHLHRRLEHCLFYAEIERLASDWQQVASLQEHQTAMQQVVEPTALEIASTLGRTADLDLQIEDAVASISSDSLKRILEELLDNAFRYSLPGSAVQLKCAAVGEQVVLSITDQGCGMSAEQAAQAGGPVPLDQVLLVQQGLGLGLIIARRLIELHHGTLVFSSEPGHGTTATVSLTKSPDW
jgi:signal transduction histidine kinase